MDFRLLVERTDPLSQPSFHLEDRDWTLSQPLDLEHDEHLPPFACISYRWGSDREPHALADGLTMPTRTLPSLAAAIRTCSCNAFWTDVFCVPAAGPERQSTLENMGYIYSRATEVVIVLGEDTFAVIQKMIQHGLISETDLQILERDKWVSSVWTYQEIVNGRSIHFVSEHPTDTSASIQLMDFFNPLGYSLWKWQAPTGSDTFTVVKAFPNLNALEDILADWRVGAYTLRSAFRVFSSLASKRNADPANYFYAILGTLTQSPEKLIWNPDQNLAEKVMAICEDKNDFSFIYTAAARDTDPRKRWRPHAASLPLDGSTVPAVLRPIFAWHCWGEAQRGHYDAAGFWLHGMTIMQPASSVGERGKDAISHWLRQPDLQHVDDTILGRTVHGAISSVGFEGEAAPILVTEGLIFAPEIVRRGDIVRLLVSNQIRWLMGAPGLMHISNGNGKQYVACMFIGSFVSLLGDGESVLL